MGKPCQWHEGCRYDAVWTERFCPAHRKAMIRKMEMDGYLEPLPSRKRGGDNDGQARPRREAQ
jgi:hypothetical protein